MSGVKLVDVFTGILKMNPSTHYSVDFGAVEKPCVERVEQRC